MITQRSNKGCMMRLSKVTAHERMLEMKKVHIQKNTRFLSGILAIMLSISLLGACSGARPETETLAVTSPVSTSTTEIAVEDMVQVGADAAAVQTLTLKETNVDVSWSESTATTIQLAGNTATYSGYGVVVENNIVDIVASGTYIITGTLDDGQIIVNTQDDGAVKLVLSGVNITSKDSAPLAITQAKELTLILADNTDNLLRDGRSALAESPADDVPDAAIYSKDDLVIGGNGSLVIEGNAWQGIVSKDTLTIAGGTIQVTATEDGIVGKDQLAILGGTLTIVAGADALKSNNDTDVSKGLILIAGGTLDITAGDDGIHAETYLQIDDGQVEIQQSYEGLESQQIVINGGDIKVLSTDDGINAAGGTEFGNYSLSVTGGNTYVNADGDGLDINGTIHMTGGTVVVDGPVANNNGAVDYDTAFQLTGGTLLAIGSAGMAMAPDASSTQNSLLINLTEQMAAGTVIQILDENGEVLTYTPEKTWQSVVFSSDVLKTGSTYTVIVDGTEETQMTISDILTSYGSTGMGGMGGRGGGGAPPAGGFIGQPGTPPDGAQRPKR